MTAEEAVRALVENGDRIAEVPRQGVTHLLVTVPGYLMEWLEQFGVDTENDADSND